MSQINYRAMRITTYIFLTVLFLCGNQSCSDDGVEELRIELVSMADGATVDDNLVERSEFEFGEDVWLALKATNLTDKEIDLTHWRLCETTANDESYLVLYEAESKNTRVGRFLPEGEIICAFILLSRRIPPGESLYLSTASWLSVQSNLPLPAGSYFSEYTLNIEGMEYYASVEFQVKSV